MCQFALLLLLLFNLQKKYLRVQDDIVQYLFGNLLKFLEEIRRTMIIPTFSLDRLDNYPGYRYFFLFFVDLEQLLYLKTNVIIAALLSVAYLVKCIERLVAKIIACKMNDCAFDAIQVKFFSHKIRFPSKLRI